MTSRLLVSHCQLIIRLPRLVHLFEDFYTKVYIFMVAFVVQKVQLHLKDEYVMMKVVKIREVDLKFVRKKAHILVQDLQLL